MVKRLSSIRFAPLTDAQLSELQDCTGLTRSELVALAIDRLHQALIVRQETPTHENP